MKTFKQFLNEANFDEATAEDIAIDALESIGWEFGPEDGSNDGHPFSFGFYASDDKVYMELEMKKVNALDKLTHGADERIKEKIRLRSEKKTADRQKQQSDGLYAIFSALQKNRKSINLDALLFDDTTILMDEPIKREDLPTKSCDILLVRSKT